VRRRILHATLSGSVLAGALGVSNPRPSPCKGGTSVLVKALLVTNRVNLSTSQYLGVPVRCYAGVMPRGGLSRRGAAKRPRSLGGH
jgi:hypothetical protein